MERARITLITVPVAIIRVNHHEITGAAASFQINLPLKTVAITVSRTEVTRTTIDTVSVPLTVNMGLERAPSNQACAISMNSVTLKTNTGLDLVPVIVKTHVILAHARNLTNGNNTAALKDAIVTVALDSLAVTSAINDSSATVTVTATATAENLAVTIVTNGHLATGHNLIHKILAGRVAHLGDVIIFSADLKNLHDEGQKVNYSKAITSILMQPTALRLSQVKLRILQMLLSRQRNATLHVCRTGVS